MRFKIFILGDGVIEGFFLPDFDFFLADLDLVALPVWFMEWLPRWSSANIMNYMETKHYLKLPQYQRWITLRTNKYQALQITPKMSILTELFCFFYSNSSIIAFLYWSRSLRSWNLIYIISCFLCIICSVLMLSFSIFSMICLFLCSLI